MSFIKKIFNKDINDSVHNQLVRFGKGVYNNRAVIKFQKGKEIKVNSTFEYANDFVELISEIVSKINVFGIVLSKEDISSLLKQNKIKGIGEEKKGGLYYQNNIEEQILNGEQLKILTKESYFTLLDINAEEIEFKCKKKLPKPGKSEGKVDDKFCILKADLKYWHKIREEFFPDIPENAKKGNAKHTFEIQKIIAPEGEKDYEKIRVMSKRAGKLTRYLEIDKQESKREVEFEV